MIKYIIYISIFCCVIKTYAQEKADLIVFNAKVYTADSAMSTAQAFAVVNGKFLEAGTDEQILKKYSATEKIDAEGKSVYPGFIDAHCHFYGYGLGLQEANLVGTKSAEEVVQKTKEFYQIKNSVWIKGRGWDQNDWQNKNYPDLKMLDEAFPDKPVFLKRVDGHAAWVNSAALRKAGINAATKVEGGEIILTKDGKNCTGILIDNAVDLVSNLIPEASPKTMNDALMSAQKNCFAVGLTTVDDAGLDHKIFERIALMQNVGLLKIRVYGMLNGDYRNYTFLENNRDRMNTDKLRIGSFKFYADGSLGSRGALLKQPYSDMKNHSGLLLTPADTLKKYARLLHQKKYQMCTHCIGDSADALMLKIYADELKTGNDWRWRIEHVQVISQEDINTFGRYNIIPSVQPTHATSDMYWAEKRLGKKRIKGAYAYQDLLKQNGWLPAGSDFPVEDINPLYGFYAAITRQDKTGYPEKGFMMENALTRTQALYAMTIWAAKSNFQENTQGSISPGKYADFVILDTDIMNCSAEKILTANVVSTYIAGEKVYGK